MRATVVGSAETRTIWRPRACCTVVIWLVSSPSTSNSRPSRSSVTSARVIVHPVTAVRVV